VTSEEEFMHMADALVSPAVGGAMWVATGTALACSAKKVIAEMDDRKVPLMGVLGAFIFAAQMINFTIPATGSSGHLGGGMILAALLGPWAAFLVMASVLTVQALFFADGGLLALGCNIFNLGVFPAFVAYPLLFKPLVGSRPTSGRLMAGSLAAAVVGLQLGAFGVVLETLFSGISDLPFATFLLLMQPIHFGIGIVEGLVTAAVIAFVWKARPEVIGKAMTHRPIGAIPLKPVLAVLGVLALLSGGLFSWFASSNPDGLEWSMAGTSGKEELEAEGGVHKAMAGLQEKTAFLPDYGFKAAEIPAHGGGAEGAGAAEPPAERPAGEPAGTEASAWPAPDAGTSLSGVLGGVITLMLATVIGLALNRRKTVSAS
jgi:cobalt/nickel transport system permease protein